MNASSRPNVLVIVMDTVRQSDFPGGSNGVDGMPRTAQLRTESVVFPQAVSPAPWTVPSHASLLTGLYPWEHGAHGRSDIRLSPNVPQLPELLRPLGYRSALLASNFLVGPETGLGTGADLACWGEWWEGYLRGYGGAYPPHQRTAADPVAEPPARPREGGLWSLVRTASPLAHRYPGTLDIAGRILRGLRPGSAGTGSGVSPWIEPTLERWLQTVPAEAPAFALINLLDAHEPYFPPEGNDTSFAEWLRYATIPQDRTGWLAGRWDPDSRSMGILLELYRHSIRSMDARIGAMIDSFRRAGRWENTLCVLTSDHGQAFGDHDLFYHMLRVDESEVRIPLWVRFPDRANAGALAKGWASLVDVAATVLESAGAGVAGSPHAMSLATLVHAERPGPVLSAADGVLWDPMARGVTSERRKQFDQPWVAAYEGSWKVTLDVQSERASAYRILEDPAEAHAAELAAHPELTGLLEAAREAGRALTSGPAHALRPEIEERLRSWGYI
ncbi:MAG: sulfatase-like hydrolase/transferase [Thermoplasmata archaeon]|nr:sulfatase-like hydrolase/transferase [Thermoplasmata archaeon]